MSNHEFTTTIDKGKRRAQDVKDSPNPTTGMGSSQENFTHTLYRGDRSRSKRQARELDPETVRTSMRVQEKLDPANKGNEAVQFREFANGINFDRPLTPEIPTKTGKELDAIRDKLASSGGRKVVDVLKVQEDPIAGLGKVESAGDGLTKVTVHAEGGRDLGSLSEQTHIMPTSDFRDILKTLKESPKQPEEIKQGHDTIPDTERQGSQMPRREPLHYKPQESKPSYGTSSDRTSQKRPSMKNLFDKYRRPKETPPPMPTSDRPREQPNAQELRNNYQALRGRYQDLINQGKDTSDLRPLIETHKDEHGNDKYNTYTLPDGNRYIITAADRIRLDGMVDANRSQKAEYNPNNTAISEDW
jgi:hypothetical protein